ncbi:hypothetical protein SAMN04488109_1635 [Chryseolinea serpens]|uniref:Uncharacterized protein n=1 Tax=Chryseolinea serpens TaxID=947013 RepID=A0A1M5M9V6_9BACT|nr:hypothetical protein SAMN04488109_1635 [Chryseolinea serpens]
MAVSVILYVDKISDVRKGRILGVFSSPEMAWQAFKNRTGRAPYSLGTFHYSTLETFQLELAQSKGVASSIKIYSHTNFDILIQWNVVDKPLP